MPRPKGSKNKKSRKIHTHKVYPVRLEKDLQAFMDSSPNKNSLFNKAVRMEMERAIKAGEFVAPEENDEETSVEQELPIEFEDLT